jgi:hypothetical protein
MATMFNGRLHDKVSSAVKQYVFIRSQLDAIIMNIAVLAADFGDVH